MANWRKRSGTAVKILGSIFLLYFIFNKIPVQEILGTISQTEPLYLILAVFFFVLSKIIAALRLNLYFHKLSLFLSQKSNLKLYLLGMFYNLFLPGGIGGDAYKGYILKKQFSVDTKKIIAVLLLDRFSGLLLLFMYACAIALLLDNEQLHSFKWLFSIGIGLSVLLFWGVYKTFFNYLLSAFWKAHAYAALVQLTQLIAVFWILKALHIENNIMAYFFIFLISSIASVLPITLGGIGSREVVFFYGATWFGLEQNTAISVSTIFFIITALVSLLGILYHFKKPLLDVKPIPKDT